MKTLRYLITFGFGIFLGGFCTALYVAFDKFMYPDPWIVVRVKNNSSQDIIGMSIKNENGSVDHIGVRKGNEVRVPVSQFGEGNYTIELRLRNGSVCASEIGYIESGSEATEWVTDEGVINDMYKKLGHSPYKCVN